MTGAIVISSAKRFLVAVLATLMCAAIAAGDEKSRFQWERLPDLPDSLGVAGPFVGVHNNALIVAGGANFPLPVWETEKQWYSAIHVLDENQSAPTWFDGGSLPRIAAYGMAVSTEFGVACLGGNDGAKTFSESFLLAWDPSSHQVTRTELPNLPQPCAYGGATLVGSTIYVAGGQSGLGLETAETNFWALDLSNLDNPESLVWTTLESWPGPARAFNIVTSQHNGYETCVYLSSGRRQDGEALEFLTDHYEYAPTEKRWRVRANVPKALAAGTGLSIGQSHILYPSGDDGALFDQADILKDEHPGFDRHSWLYHTITDTWTPAGETPIAQVTTVPVQWRGRMILASGEVRPRVRTPEIWAVTPVTTASEFGWVNYTVLFTYLLAIVAMGVYFARRNTDTNEYFRGGQHVPWWAAGCSIFATMLSSLTFTGIPSKAFAQDWVYAVGNFMIPIVAFLAVFIALPFYRRIDATSAYEYLGRRFNWLIRLFASGSFTLFHVFRMAVVMSLTGLALAVATPMTPAQSVLLMGVLSIAYSAVGGVTAVIWTDTLQTFVLLGGGVLAIILLVMGTDGDLTTTIQSAVDADKLRLANFHVDANDAKLALWVVILGAIGQNVSSYSADQAVVQRYMTTPNQSLAARSIWTNAVLAIPATILFFGIGTALFAYYRSHPERLDPTITTDQIFPLFIAREMPIGIAGLIVAGVFSAAQSTVSTSMNSTATTLVTDFIRPLNIVKTDRGYLRSAQIITLIVGSLGTVIALVFIDPSIRSLFDTFIKVIGLFMGVLGGLFLLGVFTTRTHAVGAVVGAAVGAGVMAYLWLDSTVNGYLFTSCGIASCFAAGYLTSLVVPGRSKDLAGLTIFTQSTAADSSD